MDTSLDLKLFTKVHDDVEKRQYLILHGLQKIRNSFKQNSLYPELAETVALYNQLILIKQRIEDNRQHFPKRIKRIDPLEKRIEYELLVDEHTDIQQLEGLIDWATPQIKAVIEEGIAIYEFVEERLQVDNVGIEPVYKDEGFFFVPNHEKAELSIFKYQMSIFKSSKDRYRSLKTNLVKNLTRSEAEIPPGSIKLDLLREDKTLPNPATFSFQVDLNYPFNKTIFPVVKRKLVSHIYGQA